ncbi:MAG: cupin domain-containing protein [Thermoguttaceae bacterium]
MNGPDSPPQTQSVQPQVCQAAEMIAVQQGAVVSRTLVNKPAGTVTLFAFDRGQELSEHTSPFDALVYILEGELLVTISGRGYAVTAGQMILMPAGQPHGVKGTQPAKMLLVMIRSL